MTQAEKAQLRYIAIMEQSTNAMGDLARTSQTPANALRILNQQITQLSRALGNLLIPLLQQIIPWVQAFVEVITEAIQALAVFFGFELPTIDYSGLDGVSVGASEAEDAIGGATDAAKKMKRELLGIDELTILEPNASGGAGGAGGVGGAGGDLGLDLPEYDFLGGLTDQANELKDTVKDLLYNYIIPVGTALAAWKILDLLEGLGIAQTMIGTLKKMVAGGIVAYLEFQLALGAFNDYLSQDGDIWDFVRGALVTAIGSGILYTMFGGPGLIIGLGVGIVASIVSLATNIMDGLDYTGPKAKMMQMFASMLGGMAGVQIIGGLAGAAVGFLVTAGVVLTITSITANLSGQAESGSLANALNMILSSLASGLGGAALTTALGVASGPVGFVIGAVLSFVIQGISVNWDSIVESAKSWFKNMIDEIVSIANDEALNIPQKVTAIGFNIVLGIMDGIVGALTGILDWLNTNLVQPIVNGVKSLLGIHSPSTVFEEIGENIISGLLNGISGTWQSILNFFTNSMPKWWNEYISPWFTLERWNSLVSSIGESIKSAWDSTVGQWKSDVSDWFASDVAPWFTAEKWIDLGKSAVSGLMSGLQSIFGKISNWASDVWDSVTSTLSSVRSTVSSQIDTANSIIAQNSGDRIRTSNISAFASGGFPDYGEMFIAREDGPELVGRIGNRTAVANNDQIVASLAQANEEVVNAVIAMANMVVQAINNKDTNVNLDGKQLVRYTYDMQQKYQAQRGGSLVQRGSYGV